ncbi:ral guanine nucleotide dissociation stimulator-like [Tamandua tetradactyla]|uniref:ral guanine nucleotide dissociation stimulator-like n=1 Tax=Tamandua tetradactyla TaxID=48850 RepID=UPI00405496C3
MSAGLPLVDPPNREIDQLRDSTEGEQFAASLLGRVQVRGGPGPVSQQHTPGPNLPDIFQPQSTNYQEATAEPSISGTSPSSDQLQCEHKLSSGDTTASIPGHETCTSKPDLQISLGPATECPGGQEKQYRESTSPLCRESSGVTAASSDTTFSSFCPPHVAPVRSQRASGSQPLYKKVGDSCIIRVSLDGENSTVYNSILVRQAGGHPRGPPRSDSECGMFGKFPPCLLQPTGWWLGRTDTNAHRGGAQDDLMAVTALESGHRLEASPLSLDSLE